MHIMIILINLDLPYEYDLIHTTLPLSGKNFDYYDTYGWICAFRGIFRDIYEKIFTINSSFLNSYLYCKKLQLH